MRSINFASKFVMYLCAAVALAQDPRGTIQGRVTDPSSSPVPNAAVKITNAGTGLSASATSSDSGDYRAPYLNPGRYTVEVEASGFAKYLRQNVEVRTSEIVTLDLE